MYSRLQSVFPILTCFLFCASIASPQSPKDRPRIRARRVEVPPVLDGLVNEPAWQEMEPATGLIQQQPDEGAAATEKTEVRFGYDDKYLYIGIICFDSSPKDIVVNQNRRDGSLAETDSVQVVLDTFHTKYNAFIFGTSPTGNAYDAQVSKGGQGDTNVGRPPGATQTGAQTAGAAALNLNWDAVWDVKAQVTPRGWEAEMVIPFETLRYQPGQDRTWGLQIMRNFRRRNEQSFWSPLTRAFEITQLDAEGDLEGLDLKRHRNLALVPYVLGGFDSYYTRTGDPTKLDKNAGVDLKYGLTGSLTLDATVNTDFAQVEVDEQQINLTRFNVFFPEKRPFFLENSGIFDFGTPQETEIFFSRRIGIDPSGAQIPIDAGMRVSGTAGNYELGFLNIKTREVDGLAPANDFSVIRVKRQLRNRSSVGVIGVNRQTLTAGTGVRAFNRTFGADAAIGIGRYINWQNFFAATESPGLSGSNHALASSIKYDDSHHQLIFSYKETGKNFNPEVGYLQRAGYRRPTLAYRRTFYPHNSRVRSIYPHFQLNRWYTLGSNDLESAFDHFDYAMNLQDGTTLSLPYNRYFERLDKPFEVFPGIKIPPGRYPYSQIAPLYTSNQSARFFGSAQVILGNFYNGTQRAVTLAGSVRKGETFLWSGTYTHNIIGLPVGNFTTDLVGFRFNWSFTPKSYLQTFTQYNSTTNQVATNIRFALLSTSSNGLYIVYNTNAITVDFTEPHGCDRTTNSRALLIKYSYRFNF